MPLSSTTAAVLTNNRFSLGVGTSPWAVDYDIMGVDPKRKGRRMNECMDMGDLLFVPEEVSARNDGR